MFLRIPSFQYFDLKNDLYEDTWTIFLAPFPQKYMKRYKDYVQ